MHVDTGQRPSWTPIPGGGGRGRRRSALYSVASTTPSPCVSLSGPFPHAQFNKEMVPKLTTAYYIHNFKGTRPGGVHGGSAGCRRTEHGPWCTVYG